jgi:hypothetical protein
LPSVKEIAISFRKHKINDVDEVQIQNLQATLKNVESLEKLELIPYLNGSGIFECENFMQGWLLLLSKISTLKSISIPKFQHYVRIHGSVSWPSLCGLDTALEAEENIIIENKSSSSLLSPFKDLDTLNLTTLELKLFTKEEGIFFFTSLAHLITKVKKLRLVVTAQQANILKEVLRKMRYIMKSLVHLDIIISDNFDRENFMRETLFLERRLELYRVY